MPNLENENQEPTTPQFPPIVRKEMTPPIENRTARVQPAQPPVQQIQEATPYDSPEKKKKIALQGFDYLSADNGKIAPTQPEYMELSVSEKFKEQASAFALGAVKTGRGILQSVAVVGEGVEWLVNALPGVENVDLDWDLESDSFKDKSSEEVTQALGNAIGVDFELQTEAGQAASTMINWGLGMVVGGAALKAVGAATGAAAGALGTTGAGARVVQTGGKLLTRAGKTPIGKAASLKAKETVIETLTMEAGEDNLSNLIQNTPLANPLTDYLAAKEGDSDARGKFKLAVEGFFSGVAVDVGMKGVSKLSKTLGLSEMFVRGVDRIKESKVRKAEGDEAIDIIARETGPEEVLTPEELAKRTKTREGAWYKEQETTFNLNVADERELGKSIQNLKEQQTRDIQGFTQEQTKEALTNGFVDIIDTLRMDNVDISDMSIPELKEMYPKEYAIANNLLLRATKEETGFAKIAGNFLASSELIRDGEDIILNSVFSSAFDLAARLPIPAARRRADKLIRKILNEAKKGGKSASKTIGEVLEIKEVREAYSKSPTLIAELLDTFTNADRMYNMVLENRAGITSLEEPLESLVRKPRQATTKATRSPELTREAERNAVEKLRKYLGDKGDNLEDSAVAEMAFLNLRGALMDENLTKVPFIKSLSAYTKSGMGDILTEYRYSNMLSSPRGRFLDAVSSSFQVLTDKVSETVGGFVPDRLLFGKAANKSGKTWERARNLHTRIKVLDGELEDLQVGLAEIGNDLPIDEVRQMKRDILKMEGERTAKTKQLNRVFEDLAPEIHNEVAREVGYRTMLTDRFKEVLSYYNPFANLELPDKNRAILSTIESFRSGSSITLADRSIEASAQVARPSSSVSNLFKGRKTATQKLTDEDAVELVANTFGVRASEMTAEVIDAILELNKTGSKITAMIDNWNKTAVTNSHIRSTLRTAGRKQGLTGEELEKFVSAKFDEAYDGLVFREQRALKDAEGRAIRYFDSKGSVSDPSSVVDESGLSPELEVFISEEYRMIAKTADEVANTKRFDPRDGMLATLGEWVDSGRRGQMGKFMTHIIPFLRTPINLAISADRMFLDPMIGFAGKVVEKGTRKIPGMENWTIPDQLKGYKNQFIADLNSNNPALRARAMGRFATGTSFIAAATTLSYNTEERGWGLIGPGPGWQDKRHQAWLEAGNIPYSIKFPNGTSIEFKKLGPIGIALGAVTTATQVNQFSAEDADDLTGSGVIGAMSFIAEETNMTAMSNILNAIEDDSSEGLVKLERILLGIAGQYLPGGSITRDVRKYQSGGVSVATDYDWNFVEDSLEKLKQHYGMVDSAGRVRRNFFGEPIKKTGYTDVEIGNPRINPFTIVSTKKGDPVMAELLAMDYGFPANTTTQSFRDSTGEKKRIDLSQYYNKDTGQEAFDRFNELMGTVKIGGKTFKEHLQSRMSDEAWKNYPNNVKTAIVKEYRAAAKALSLLQIQKEYGEQMGLVSPETQDFLK